MDIIERIKFESKETKILLTENEVSMNGKSKRITQNEFNKIIDESKIDFITQIDMPNSDWTLKIFYKNEVRVKTVRGTKETILLEINDLIREIAKILYDL